MLRLILKLSLLLTLLAALPIFLIRAQPYDGSDLRAFLTPPEGCPAPCFMGIRPGVTTAEEAIAILEAHEWVAKVDNPDPYGDGIFLMPISWTWNQMRPEWINEKVGGEAWINIRSGLVMEMQVDSSVSMGDMLLTLGNPEQMRVYSYSDMFGNGWVQDGWYRSRGIRFIATGFCPLRQADLYTSQTLLFFNEVSSNSRLTDSPHC